MNQNVCRTRQKPHRRVLNGSAVKCSHRRTKPFKKANKKEGGELMQYNYAKLKGRIIEICGTQQEFAKRMNLSERTVSAKLNNQVSWKQSEILKAVEILMIPEDQIQIYFFALEVHQ